MTTLTQPLVVALVDLDDVAPHPRNARRDLGPLDELAASIRADGVRSPIHVRPTRPEDSDPQGRAWTVVAGHRRRAAAILAGHAQVPAIVRHDLTTDADDAVEMAVENLNRRDLTVAEVADLYQQLTLAGLDAAGIAARTGRPTKVVRAHLQVAALPDDTRTRVHDGQVTLEQALVLAEHADNPAALDVLEQAAGTPGWEWAVAGVERIRLDETRRARTAAELTAAGVTVVAREDLRHGWAEHGLDVVYAGVTLTVPGAAQPVVDAAREAAHRTCPHHAVEVRAGGRTRPVCLDPTVHTPDVPGQLQVTDALPASSAPGVGMVDAADDEAAARERDACGTAAAARARFVRAATGRRLTAGAVAAVALHAAECMTGDDLLPDVDPADVAPFLGVEVPDPPVGGPVAFAAWRGDVAGRVRAAMAAAGGVGALLAAVAAVRERDLGHVWSWDHASPRVQAGAAGRAWLGLLAELGYGLSEWERDRLAAADAWAATRDAER
jgi:ParB/RepB/Spo0J family partition protein